MPSNILNASMWTIGRVYTQKDAKGPSYVYTLGETSLQDAKPKLLEIVNYLKLLLPYNAYITYAAVHLSDREKNALQVIGAFAGNVPLEEDTATSAIDYREPCNNAGTCFNFKFQTVDGKYCNRPIRLLRDSWVSNDYMTSLALVNGQIDASTVYFPAEVSGNYTGVNALKNYLLSVMKNSYLHQKKVVAGAVQHNLLAFDSVIFRGVGTRDTGRPFGMSRGRRAARV